MQKISPYFIVGFLTLGITIGMLGASPFPQDDHFLYQKFIEVLAAGKLDLTIPGFHGSDFIAVIWHWIHPSSISQIEFQGFTALLLPLLAFLAGKAIYKSVATGILLSCIIALMPFVSFVYLRGWTGPAYMCLMLLTIYGAASSRKWTWLPWGLAIITKPFALALLPIIILYCPSKGSILKRYRQILLGLSIPALYVIIQYLQVGHILVGAHHGINELNVWNGPLRMIMNAAHALQMLFSVHNYYYPDPALTGPGNMMHTSPLLIFLGLCAIFHRKRTKKSSIEERLPMALFSGFIIGIALNIPLDHMDHFYMQAGILCLILAALPMLLQYPIWIPLVLATLHFQWLYFYLQYNSPFSLGWTFFALPIVVDVLFGLYVLYTYVLKKHVVMKL